MYRSAYPTGRNLRFLRRLRLRSVVSLTPEEEVSQELGAFCAAEGVARFHWRVERMREGRSKSVTLGKGTALEVLEVLVNPANLPVLVHCMDGTHVTGLVILVLRKLQNYNLGASLNECVRSLKESSAGVSAEERHFVETCKGSIVLPMTLPAWLWGGKRVAGHSHFKLTYLQAEPRAWAEAEVEGEEEGEAEAKEEGEAESKAESGGGSGEGDGGADGAAESVEGEGAGEPCGTGGGGMDVFGPRKSASLFLDALDLDTERSKGVGKAKGAMPQ